VFQASRPAPAPVTGLGSGATAISAGDRHTCAAVAGAIECWGDDSAGQLGDGASQNSAVPRIAIGTGATAVATGSAHSCAVTGAAGAEALSCWGDNSSGQVADGVNSPTVLRTPAAIDLGTFHPTGASAGSAHTCAFSRDAPGPLCFGSNASSELGLPATPRGSNMLGISAVHSVAAGYHHTCALLADGSVWCWGANDRGQLGNGSPGGAVATPVEVSGR